MTQSNALNDQWRARGFNTNKYLTASSMASFGAARRNNARLLRDIFKAECNVPSWVGCTANSAKGVFGENRKGEKRTSRRGR